MIGQTVSHYKITAELGGGGMGVIYKAEDTRLKRTVVLKFLPSELTGDDRARPRFIQEARAASAHDHPNICTIYEIDETRDGQVFICMAYYDGESLKERLTRGPLAVGEAVDLAIQIGEGLAQVHKLDIIHRDIKPANLMITKDGVVKIVDFGVAKLTGGARLLEFQSSAGTIPYMSPEQAQGEELDHRTDIWSLGAVLYEMVTGKWPFKGTYSQAIVYSIVNLNPPSITELDSTLPARLERIVDKAMSKDVKKRYQSAPEMVSDLKSFRASLKSGGAPVKTKKPPARPAIAVLPFVNMSADAGQDFFCDGITEDIINYLAHIKDLQVAARSSSFAFKGKSMDARKIGRALGVDVLLEGSVRKAVDRLRITTQLTNVANGFQMWSDRYDRKASDVFTIQDEIAHNIVRALEIKLSPGERKALPKPPTHDVAAYECYLRGRRLFHQKRPAALRQALEMFSQAIKRDPDYALAHSGLADCYSYLALFEAKEDNLKRSFRAVKKALELDPDLAEAYASMGLSLALSGRGHEETDEAFEMAIRLNPALFEAFYFYGYGCRIQKRWEKAAGLFEWAAAISPDDYQVQNHLGMAYKTLKLRDKAERAYRRSVINIEHHLELNPDDTRALQMGAVALIELGDLEKGLEWGEKAVAMDPENPLLLYNSACVFSVSGDTERAMDCLERAVRTGYSNTGALLSDPDLDPIRKHARFHSLLEQLD